MQEFDPTLIKNSLTITQLFEQVMKFGKGWLVGFGLLVLMMFLPLIVLVLTIDTIPTAAFVVLVLLSFGGLYGMIDLHRQINEISQAAIFSRVNNMIGFWDSVPRYKGTIFRLSRMFVLYSIRTRSPLFVEMGQVRPTWRQRRSSYALTYTFVRIKLPRQLPHFVLKHNKSPLLLSLNLPAKQVELPEGSDVNYRLYTEPGSAHDARQVFTSDVVNQLASTFGACDCEIIDDELYVYLHEKVVFLEPKNYHAMIAGLREVMRVLEPRAGTYEFETAPVVAFRPQSKPFISAHAAVVSIGVLSVIGVVIMIAIKVFVIKLTQ